MAKEGASTSPVPGSYPYSDSGSTTTRPSDRKDPLEPPSYSETVAGDPPAPQAGTSLHHELPPASNYNAVENSNGSIKGTWVIDTTIEVPEALRTSKGFFGILKEQDNLSLSTTNGPIGADIHLVSNDPKRATIGVKTQNGRVTIKLNRLYSQAIKLNGKTSNGPIRMAIPRNFVGPVKAKTNWGTVTFSDAIQKRTATFSKDTAFIGDWQSAGFRDYKTWNGDEIDIQTSNGNIDFAYVDEVEPEFVESGPSWMESTMQTLSQWWMQKHQHRRPY